MQIGLFFGSFNPVHTGHLMIASFMAENTKIDKIWFIVSPQNPFKKNNDLLDENKRLELLKLAVNGDNRFEVCDIEFKMERPSYTIKTLDVLASKYPEHNFSLIMGGDNYEEFHKWKDYERILTNNKIFVYSRRGFAENSLLLNHPNISILDIPFIDISSTYIRQNIKKEKSIKYFVPDKVEELILKEKLYI